MGVRRAYVVSVTDLAPIAEARRLANSGEARRIREAAQISAREMADAVAVHVTSLLAWESGESIPRKDAAARWLAQLDLLRAVTAGTAQPPSPGSTSASRAGDGRVPDPSTGDPATTP